MNSYLERRKQRYVHRQRQAESRLRKLKLWLSRSYDRLWYLRGPYRQEKLDYWYDLNTRIEAFLSGIPAERQLRIQFEELVRSPTAQLERLCDAVGLDLESAMLRPHENVPSALAWGLGNEKVHLRSSIDASVADHWRNRLSEGILTAQTREVMQRITDP
jgi:hypothetical protein